MDVDVPNACGTITDPAAPMALRLQGNLLQVTLRSRQRSALTLAATESPESFLNSALTS